MKKAAPIMTGSSFDTVTPFLRRVAADLPERAMPVAGRAASNLFVRHFRDLSRQRHRPESPRNYYADAAKSTGFLVTPKAAYVEVGQVGIGLHLRGGTVRPKRAKALTIPTRRAQGRRAREIQNLFVLKARSGRTWLAQNDNGRVRLFFLLVKKADIPRDPTVIPSDADIERVIDAALKQWMERQYGR
jgi:hypothetical protein